MPQEPTVMGKTNNKKENKEEVSVKTETQEPISIREVVPQEPILPLDTTNIEVHSEAHIIEDTTRMLKGFATSMIATTSQLKISQSLEVSIKRYAPSFLNAIP